MRVVCTRFSLRMRHPREAWADLPQGNLVYCTDSSNFARKGVERLHCLTFRQKKLSKTSVFCQGLAGRVPVGILEPRSPLPFTLCVAFRGPTRRGTGAYLGDERARCSTDVERARCSPKFAGESISK